MATIALLLLTSACHDHMNMMAPVSESAARVAALTWFMIVLSTIIFIVVMGAMAVAVKRNRGAVSDAPDLSPRSERWIFIGGIFLPALVLMAVFIVSLRSMGSGPRQQPVFTVLVTGHQWWWQLQYHPGGDKAYAGANEIHVPVGKTVRILLTSADVIHSFWVPRVQGKMDVLPGDTNTLYLAVDAAGVYHGKCAEFCGQQHTNMAITVVAEDSASFQRWQERQRANAVQPADSLAMAGARIFATAACIGCHAVRGTVAVGTDGPDLTHVASRLTIGGGVLPTNRATLEGWIGNAPAIKPGTVMPPFTGHSGAELRAIAAYVASLR